MPAAAAVGVLLLAAAIAGAAGALLLIRAANRRPSVIPARAITSRAGADHQEALSAAAALRRGIALTLACAALPTAAAGVTWYGPTRNQPALRVTTPDGIACGTLTQAKRRKHHDQYRYRAGDPRADPAREYRAGDST